MYTTIAMYAPLRPLTGNEVQRIASIYPVDRESPGPLDPQLVGVAFDRAPDSRNSMGDMDENWISCARPGAG